MVMRIGTGIIPDDRPADMPAVSDDLLASSGPAMAPPLPRFTGSTAGSATTSRQTDAIPSVEEAPELQPPHTEAAQAPDEHLWQRYWNAQRDVAVPSRGATFR